MRCGRSEAAGRVRKTADGSSLLVALVALLLSVAGCNKKSGDAIVLFKEHIAAAASPAPAAASTPENEQAVRPMRDDEIAVDQYVMKAAVRGTSQDPRAFVAEQWLVQVELVSGGLKFSVQAHQAQWEKLKIGDRIKVTYSQGKYTGTVWGAEIR